LSADPKLLEDICEAHQDKGAHDRVFFYQGYIKDAGFWKDANRKGFSMEILVKFCQIKDVDLFVFAHL